MWPWGSGHQAIDPFEGCTSEWLHQLSGSQYTDDTDVQVILLGKFHYLMTLCQDISVWVAFGTGKNFTYYHINAVYNDLGSEKSLALPVFHSFTGCDTTSAFLGQGKKAAWEAWDCFEDVTFAFAYMALHLFTEVSLDADHFKLLERFTVVMYDKSSELEDVNEARRELFCQKGKTMKTIPPTQDALLQHSKRAAYQAGVWCASVNRLRWRLPVHTTGAGF